MASKLHKEFKERCIEWRDRLWLREWELTVETKAESLEEPKMRHSHSGEAQVAARSVYSPAYQTVAVTGHLPSLAAATPGKRNSIACHELCHALVGPVDIFVGQLIGQFPSKQATLLEELWEEHKERLTTHICNVAVSAYEERDGLA